MNKKLLILITILLFSTIKHIQMVKATNYYLSVESIPTNITFQLNGTNYITEYNQSIAEGIYNITFPETHIVATLTYRFQCWIDNATNTNRTRFINLNQTSSYEAIYKSDYTPIAFTGEEPIFISGMNDWYEDLYLYDSMVDEVGGGSPEGARRILIDKSPYENHGVLYPDTEPYDSVQPTWGRYGKALEFDGINDRIAVVATSTYMKEAFTVSFWFMAYNSTKNQMLMSRTGLNQWALQITDNKIIATVWTSDAIIYSGTSINNITDGIFYHTALTYDYRNGFAVLYLNGVVDTLIETNGKILRNSGTVNIGSNGTSLYFNGVIDELQLYTYSRTPEQVYSTARTPVVNFGTWTFKRYYDLIRSGLVNQDYELPYANSSLFFVTQFIRTIRYIHGFQQYQLYCTLKYDTNDNTTYAPTDTSITWYWGFLKHGILQHTYYIEIAPYYMINEQVTMWTVTLGRESAEASPDTEVHSWNFYVNNTLYPDELPIIVSAWIGSDDTHFTMRVDAQDERLVISPQIQLPFKYQFELMDIDSNVRRATWFDGAVLHGIKAKSYWNVITKWYDMRIKSHKLIGLIAVIVMGVITAGYIIWNSLPQEIRQPIEETVHEVIDPVAQFIQGIAEEIGNFLKPIIEMVGTALKIVGDVVVDALSGLAHDIIAGLMTIGTFIGDAFAPVTNALWQLGASFVDGFIAFMTPVIGAILNAIHSLGSAIIDGMDIFLEVVFGMQPNSFSNFIYSVSLFFGQIGILASWIGNGIVNVISLMVSMLQFFGTAVYGFIQFIAYAIENILTTVADGVTLMYDWWNGTGMFSNTIALKDIVYLALIIYPCALFMRVAQGGFDVLWHDLDVGWKIVTIIKELALFGFTMLRWIVDLIMKFIPFFG